MRALQTHLAFRLATCRRQRGHGFNSNRQLAPSKTRTCPTSTQRELFSSEDLHPPSTHLDDAAAHSKCAGAQPRKSAERRVEQGRPGRPVHVAFQRLVARCPLRLGLAQQVEPGWEVDREAESQESHFNASRASWGWGGSLGKLCATFPFTCSSSEISRTPHRQPSRSPDAQQGQQGDRCHCRGAKPVGGGGAGGHRLENVKAHHACMAGQEAAERRANCRFQPAMRGRRTCVAWCKWRVCLKHAQGGNSPPTAPASSSSNTASLPHGTCGRQRRRRAACPTAPCPLPFLLLRQGVSLYGHVRPAGEAPSAAAAGEPALLLVAGCEAAGWVEAAPSRRWCSPLPSRVSSGSLHGKRWFT